MNGWTVMAAGTALALEAGAALAQQGTGVEAAPMPMAAPQPCASPAPLPAEYAGWGAMTPLATGSTADRAPALPLATGVRLALGEAAAVRWAASPGHVSAPGTRGGLVALTIATPGRYQVALGAGVWVDMVHDGAALPSVAHGHGPACTPIRKVVAFNLRPGRYLLQLSGAAAPTLALLATRVAG